MQRLQFNLPKDLEEKIGLPCHSISREVRSLMSFSVVFLSLIACRAKCFTNESKERPLLANLTVLLKCCVILVSSFCCLHLT